MKQIKDDLDYLDQDYVDADDDGDGNRNVNGNGVGGMVREGDVDKSSNKLGIYCLVGDLSQGTQGASLVMCPNGYVCKVRFQGPSSKTTNAYISMIF